MNNKHILALTLSAATLVAALQGNLARADEILRPGNDINCTNLTSSDETTERLLDRYGSQARIEELKDTEGEPFSGVAIYPNDPQLRIEIEPEDAGRDKKVIGIGLVEKKTKWSIFGLRTGMTVDQVTAANGGPLRLTGFWQHPDGSYSVFGDFKPRRLAGGCRLIVSLAAPEGIVTTDDPLYGRSEILSTDPELMKRRPTVDGLFIVYNSPFEE